MRWPRGLMDKASDFESEDCEFESRRGRDPIFYGTLDWTQHFILSRNALSPVGHAFILHHSVKKIGILFFLSFFFDIHEQKWDMFCQPNLI